MVGSFRGPGPGPGTENGLGPSCGAGCDVVTLSNLSSWADTPMIAANHPSSSSGRRSGWTGLTWR
jgi:hypothetical protein